MATRRFTTEFVITGDSSSGVNASRELQQANADMTREMQRAEHQSEATSQSLDNVADHAQRLAAVSATTAAAMGAMAVSQTRNIAEQAALSRSIGVTVQTLQQWEFAAQSVSLGAGSMGDVFKDAAEKIGEFANSGGGEAADLFERLNLNIADLMAMSPDRQLLAIGQALDDVATQGEKVFFMETLANDASRLLPLLEDNATLLKEQISLSEQLGVAIPQSDVDSIESANQALNELTAIGTGFANQIAVQWAPSIVELSGAVQDVVVDLGGMGDIAEDVADGIVALAVVLSARLAGAMAATAVATVQNINAQRALAAQATQTASVEAGAALAAARRAEAEQAAAVVSAKTAAQRAQAAQVEASAQLRSIQLTQQQMAAERALETQRLQAQISATGRQQSLTRLAEIRRTEIALNGQAAAAEKALTAAKVQSGSATRMLTAAEVDLARATTVTTGAANANTAALGANTAAQRAMTFASRGAASAMALVGGPTGVALIAAYGLYQMAESMKASDVQAEKTEFRVGELTGKIQGMTRAIAENKITELKSDLADLEVQAAASAESMDKANASAGSSSGILGVSGKSISQVTVAAKAQSELAVETSATQKAIESLEKHVESLGEGAEDTATQIKAFTASQDADAAKKQADALKALQQEMDPLLADHETYVERLQVLDAALAANDITQIQYAESVQWAAKQYTDAATGAEEYEKRVKSLVGEFDGQEQKAQKLRQALIDINEAYRRGDVDGMQYQRMVKSVRDEMAQLADESDPISKEMAKSWEEAAKRIDETFADAFTGAFDSFDDFGDQLLDSFKRLLAELAYQATLKPIVVGFTSDMQSMMGQSGGGVGGTGTGSWDNTLKGFEGAKKAWDWLSASGVSAATPGSASIGYGGAGWAAQANTGTYTGWAGSASSAASTAGGGWGAAASNVGTGLATAGAGYVGSYAGTELGSALTGKTANSNYGATIGTAAGAYIGSIVPVIGTVIGAALGGAIGGLADSAFGSGRKSYGQIGSEKEGIAAGGFTTRDVYGEPGNTRYAGMYAESAFGGIGVTKKQKTDDGALKDMVSAFVEIDNSLASVMTAAQLESTRNALDGWRSSKTENIGKIVDQRLSAVVEATDSIFENTLKGMDRESLVQGLVGGLQIENVGAQMATAVAADMNEQFREVLKGGNAEGIDAATQSLLAAAGAVRMLGSTAETLNLQFDETASGALDAAANIAGLAGGFDSLASLQDSYLQNYFSEEERRELVIKQLTKQIGQFNAATEQSINSKGGLRDYIESLDLMTESGQEAYASALNIATAFDQLAEATDSALTAVNERYQALLATAQATYDSTAQAVAQAAKAFNTTAFSQQLALLELAGDAQAIVVAQREKELAAIDESLRPTQRRIWALQDEAAAQKAAAAAGEEYASALASAQEWLGSTLEGISGWVDQQRATGGSPPDNLGESRSQFDEQLALAQGGDREALQSITQYADRLLSSSQEMFASGPDAQAEREKVLAALEDLPDAISAEQYIADEIKQALREQTSGITDRLGEVLVSGTPAKIAEAMSGSFEDLTRGVGGVLTREQLATVMQGKATDAQIDALMGMVDLNGDGIISGLESVIIKSLPSDTLLSNVIKNQLEATRNKQLTHAQVRSVLSPIATDKQINALIERVDVNGDGIITEQELANARIGGLSDGIAGSLSGYFDQLDDNLDGKLTFAELKAGLSGIATDAQLKAMMSSMDLNGDGIISGLESVIIKSLPSDTLLSNVIKNQLEATRNKQLTHAQVRSALSPIATDKQINALIERVDVNGDGIITEQELANARISGLSDGIAGSLSGYFDKLDDNLDGKLTFAELKAGLGGIATDAQLKAMMSSMDLNGDGIISGLESVIIKSMPTDARLGGVIKNQLEATRNKQLTHAQVRNALAPIATDKQINALIERVDVNGDGIITEQELANARIGGLSDGIAGSLSGYFDQLDDNLDGKLTFAELKAGLGGIATDAQLKAMMSSMDLNGDGIISGLESVIIKSMPTDARLGGVIKNQLEATRNKQLTHAQVRNALAPIATDKQINALIERVDVNGDGIITEQELANARISQLAVGIGNTLKPMFDGIDLDLDGVIDYEEFGKQFAGMASDAELKRIFHQLDVNGDGTISAIEAGKASTDEVSSNTKPLEDSARDQLATLNGLVDEMSRSTDQFIGLNTTMISLRDSINALGVAQEEIARIEKERVAAEKAERDRIEKERKAAEAEAAIAAIEREGQSLAEGRRAASSEIEVSEGVIKDREKDVTPELRSTIDSILDEGRSLGSSGEMELGDWEYLRTTIIPNSGLEQWQAGLARHMAVTEWRERYLDLTEPKMDRLRKQYKDLTGDAAPFAKGGVFANSVVDDPTYFNMGLMGEAGPEAIMPLQRGANGVLGVRAELSPVSLPPLLGKDDAIEVLRDMQREMALLRRENKELLGRIEQHGGAAVAVQQAGFQRQISEQQRGNRSLDEMRSSARLEASR